MSRKKYFSCNVSLVPVGDTKDASQMLRRDRTVLAPPVNRNRLNPAFCRDLVARTGLFQKCLNVSHAVIMTNLVIMSRD